MEKHKQGNEFRSLEQVKALLFPSLSVQEREQMSRQASREIGASMADEAVDHLLREYKKECTKQ